MADSNDSKSITIQLRCLRMHYKFVMNCTASQCWAMAHFQYFVINPTFIGFWSAKFSSVFFIGQLKCMLTRTDRNRLNYRIGPNCIAAIVVKYPFSSPEPKAPWELIG